MCFSRDGFHATSMDQVIASEIGNRTAVSSLVLGIEPNELRLEDGLSMIYGSSLSWASPTKPATKEIYPSRAFDRLVGDEGPGAPGHRAVNRYVEVGYTDQRTDHWNRFDGNSIGIDGI